MKTNRRDKIHQQVHAEPHERQVDQKKTAVRTIVSRFKSTR